MKSKSIRSYLFAGLVVWLPILVTFVVLRFMVDLLDSTIALLPSAYRPERLLGVDIPGFGVIFSLVLLILTGLVATNILGQRLFGWGEALLARIPLVRSIYNASKQVIQAIFATNSQAFRKVLLIEYPRKDSWSLAFMTGNPGPQLFANTTEEMVSVFVPTTPNPTSGFLMMVPKKDVIEVGMTIDEALKYIISLGVMPPTLTPEILTHAN
ncbi:DUF502 domain-containing protein [Legionella taurinensis]|uniref:DUF502 domain-containing protein n=1 Tax=Legionella taurinensis TaxID=70611 RepID=A0A3A5L2R6_9GAMM|nr:DUF502 domain-containing protein [Legionella taurinensis]MDX1838310.1 DUF502 domain-containing protein [Legionella taurinensis]PUT39202.1 hypothetical protein DB744_10160 [Legionella taurinensis]PUT39529.1 hypothetical protein DB746_13625 [Legionella taurinensis]PUT43968.1 hypothetical protein DB743_08880 [Legionella taurinensis]PUT45032.1 hypothetical protein DB745_13565 [Legionella taurinensis]